MTTRDDDHPADLASIDNRLPSLGAVFFGRVRETPNAEAYRFPDESGGWQSRTWAETGDEVSRIAAGLIALGVEAEQRVAIASSTRYEWIVADLAIVTSGAATTTVYSSTIAPDVAYIVADSDSVVVFAEDDVQIAKLREYRDELPDVATVVTFDGTADDGEDPWVISLATLEEMGEKYLGEHPTAVEDRVEAIRPESLATLIYTSGTTGRPKGVRLTNSAWTYEGAATTAHGQLNRSDVQFLWLPMAHSFGKVLLASQLQIGFATAVDGRVDKIVENLAVVKPTMMGAAPRIFEKAYGRIVTMIEEEGGVKAKLFDWAVGVGLKRSRALRNRESISAVLKVQHAVADKLVLSKIRERFGGRVRFFISGSAPLSYEVAEWFDAVGIVILEGYGLTETAAGSCLNRPWNYKFGTVGPPFPGTEIKIADDGEVLLRGPGVMDSYHNLEADTRAALVGDGWFATGDIGELDDDGYLRITDRKKDLFKTSGGKYVAPSHIEGIFKGVCPLASQMVVHGDNRNFCSALITLDADAVAEWASKHGMDGWAYADIVGSAEMHEVIQGHVDELNGKLNRWETIKKFVILDHDLSIERNELTPSLKLRRRVVEDKHRDKLDALYD
ncbi:MAG: AMP-dependent synthetase/ligase [Nocardioidaceae bacterium]